jgi:hypothetical protein
VIQGGLATPNQAAGPNAGTAGGGATGSFNPPVREIAALSGDFAANAINLLDLGGGEGTWSGCLLAPGQTGASATGTAERFVVDKSGKFFRTRTPSQGAKCETPVGQPTELDGTLKIVSQAPGSGGDIFKFYVDLQIPTFAAPVNGQPAQGQPAQVIHQLIEIHRQEGQLYFGIEPTTNGGPAPTTVSGGYMLTSQH